MRSTALRIVFERQATLTLEQLPPDKRATVRRQLERRLGEVARWASLRQWMDSTDAGELQELPLVRAGLVAVYSLAPGAGELRVHELREHR